MTRLEAIARTAALVWRNIEANGGKYSGLMVPNLQTVIDLAMLPDDLLPAADLSTAIEDLERHRPPMFCSS